MIANATSAAAAPALRASARARAIRVAPGKHGPRNQAESKRVGLVLRPGMKQSEFRRVERRLEQNRLATLPIIVGAPARRTAPSAPICGLIIFGSDAAVQAADRRGLQAVVREAIERDAPVLALSDAAALALAAVGKEAPSGPHDGVLIADRIEPLAFTEIERAIDRIAASPPRP